MSKKTRGRYVAAKNTGGSKMKKYAFGIDVGELPVRSVFLKQTAS